MTSHTRRVLGSSYLTIWAFVALAFAIPAKPALAQTPPLEAKLSFVNPPPKASFADGTPITIRLQVRNVSNAIVRTTAGFSKKEFPRFLVVTDAAGARFGSPTAAEAHPVIQPSYCFSRNGTLPSPLGIPVVPLELLQTNFGQEYIFDARTLYPLTRPGRYSVETQIPLLTFDSQGVISDCDDFPLGTQLVNVGGGPENAPGGQPTPPVKSNLLEFSITRLAFGGFSGPLSDDTTCARIPCQTMRLGRTLPVKFTLRDANNRVVSNATPRIAVTQISGTAPAQPPQDLGTGPSDSSGIFRFDPTSQEYVYNLNTKVLSVGVWRIDVVLDDQTVHYVHVGLR